MANKFWARKDSKYKVISSVPSVNLTQIGNAIVPVPYPVSEKLSKAVSTSKNVLVNGKQTYIDGSNTSSVKGDGKGSKGGVKSGTVEAKSEPIVGMASPMVKINKQRLVREGDLQMMQGGNTIGKITCSESASVTTITDDGQIEGETLPADLSPESAGELHLSAGQPVGRQPMPRVTKPTANNGSGVLGATTGSPVILHTGQLYHVYDYMGINLAGLVPIALVLHYLSDSHYSGFFGRNRRFHYEKQFVQINESTHRLYQVDGRKFDFVAKGKSFIDSGKLGVDIIHRGQDFILRYFDLRVEVYRAERLIEIRDANQNSLHLDYHVSGALKRIYNNSGASLHFEYNQQHVVSSMYDHAQRRWQYHYDELNNLVEITPPAGRSEHYCYQNSANAQSSSNLVEVSDSKGSQKLSVSYQDDGRVHSYRQAETSYTYVYHQHQLIEKIDSQNRSTLYGLGDDGLIKAITAADGSTQRESYDPQTRTAKIIVNEGDPRIEKYDERHRLISVTNGCCAGCGHEVKYHYEGNNTQPTQVIDDGRKIINQYDASYNHISTTTSGGVEFYYQYDKKGRRIASTDARGFTTRFNYNDKDQLVRIIDARGSIFQIKYDMLSRKISQTDPEGHTEHFSYDSLDEVTHHRNALGQTTQFAFDDIQQLQYLVDPRGQQTRYLYNLANQLVGQTSQNGQQKRYRKNEQGQLSAIIREDGSELHFKYDGQNKLVQVAAMQRIADSSADKPRYIEEHLSCTYDADGDLISAALNGQNLSFEYDSQSRLIASGQHGLEVSRWYSSKGDLHTGIGFMGQSYNYRYNDDGQIIQIQRDLDCIIQKHNPNGDVTQRTYSNHVGDTIAYDEVGNITHIKTSHTGKRNTLCELRYTLNSRGFVSRKQRSQGPTDDANSATDYQYDEVGRLTRAGQQHFAYDAAGNLVRCLENNQVKQQASYSASNNQLLKNLSYEFRYDPRGNLIAKRRHDQSQITYYTYNLFDQLQDVSVYDAQKQLTKRLQFRYDALNRRVSKRVIAFDTQQQATQTTHHYLYDQNNIVAILDENKNLLANIVHSDEIDTPLSITTFGHPPLPLTDIERSYFDSLGDIDKQSILKSKTERTYYYHRDHQGSITMLTDAQGQIVERFDYDDAYGTVLTHYKAVETYNPYAYTAREYDAPDLYYYRARYYDPQSQRFISPDPMGFISGDSNLYRYVENNPVNFTDPAGYNAVCKAIERKKNKLYRKAIKPLAKTIAKQTAKLGAAAVPFVGWAMAAWTAYDMVQLGLDLKNLYNEFDALEDALQKCLAKSKKVKTTKTKEKNKSKGRPTKVKCFKKNNKKHDAKEYDRQLKNQQDGLNSMSTDEYIKGRGAFSGMSCKDGKPSTEPSLKNRPKRDASAARKARKAHQQQLEADFDRNGSLDPAGDAAKAMKSLAALHNPDMIAAGKDVITGFGDSGINSSLGRQWQDRVGDLDAAACKAQKEGRGKEKMNTELKRCK